MKSINFLFLLPFLIFLSSCDNNPDNAEMAAVEFQLPDNFELETLYSPNSKEMGSWVALARGPEDKMFACDQHGNIYTFSTPGIGEVLDSTEVRPLEMQIGSAHGLLWAHNSLYVAVNKRWEDEDNKRGSGGSGVYRITDSDDDGTLDTVNMLLKLEGDGEHGPHSLIPAPDGDQIYFIAGNHVLLPEELKQNSRLPSNWGEDQLLPPYLDARGHANEIKAPGGWIARFDADGSNWEVISAGYRNAFDIAFNKEGELFAYDADMEWDIGMPWYRPTRICHVTSGSEYGWRTGSGKWPDYYPDNLPAVHNMAQGSPTGILMGSELNFPPPYQEGLFVMDWSFGTLYFLNLIPEGSSYKAEKEVFLAGKPLPLTDMVAGADGHLYFASGGRRLDSHLYRLRYTGEPGQKAAESDQDQEALNLRNLRKRLETLHGDGGDMALDSVWNYLGHSDRHIRYAARVALEHQPTGQWEANLWKENDATRIVEGGIALIHQGDQSLRNRILQKFNNLEFSSLDENTQLGLLRAYSLLFIRMGEPGNRESSATIRSLQPAFPDSKGAVQREIAQILLFLKADGITGQLVELLENRTEAGTAIDANMLSGDITDRSEQYGPLIKEVAANMPPQEAIYYGMLLSNAEEGWNRDLRERYFQWFYDVLSAKGGMSFKAYMENVRLRAMSHVPETQKEYFQEISGVYSPESVLEDLPEPIGPGRNYSANEIGDIMWNKAARNYSGSVEAGERAYKAALCVSCHRMKGDGGATGPDLTQINTKFNAYDLLYSIYSPNDAISDQYANTLLTLEDGKKIAGRLISEEGDSIRLQPNPYNTAYTIGIAKSSVAERGLSPISPMPPGLLNRLNEQEIADLLAYLLAGGDGQSEIYTGEKESAK